jgi:hypothetical protein
MPIQWDILEYKLDDYLKKGKDDKNRTFEQVSLDVEDMYINSIVGNAQDAFGNIVLSLNRFALAATLRQGFKDALSISLPIYPNRPILKYQNLIFLDCQFQNLIYRSLILDFQIYH